MGSMEWPGCQLGAHLGVWADSFFFVLVVVQVQARLSVHSEYRRRRLTGISMASLARLRLNAMTFHLDLACISICLPCCLSKNAFVFTAMALELLHWATIRQRE